MSSKPFTPSPAETAAYDAAKPGDPAIVGGVDRPEEVLCDASAPKWPYLCTRPKHTGQHVAEGETCVVATWSDGDAEENVVLWEDFVVKREVPAP